MIRNRQLMDRSRTGWDFFRDVDELFQQLHSSLAPMPSTEMSSFEDQNNFRPPIDVRENEKGYLLAMDIPGVQDKDVKVEVNDGVLTVSGERRRENKTTTAEGWTRSERSFGRFTRSFALPKDVDSTKIEAQFDAGELHLFLPRGEGARPQAIQIKSRSTEQQETGEVKGLMDRFFASKDVNSTKKEDVAKH